MYIIGDDMMNVAYSMLNIFALIILIILMVIFFSKKRLHNIEDNTYGWLLIVSFFDFEKRNLKTTLNKNLNAKAIAEFIKNNGLNEQLKTNLALLNVPIKSGFISISYLLTLKLEQI